MLTASKRTEKCPTPGQRFSEALPPGGKCLTNARGGWEWGVHSKLTKVQFVG